MNPQKNPSVNKEKRLCAAQSEFSLFVCFDSSLFLASLHPKVSPSILSHFCGGIDRAPRLLQCLRTLWLTEEIQTAERQQRVRSQSFLPCWCSSVETQTNQARLIPSPCRWSPAAATRPALSAARLTTLTQCWNNTDTTLKQHRHNADTTLTTDSSCRHTTPAQVLYRAALDLRAPILWINLNLSSLSKEKNNTNELWTLFSTSHQHSSECSCTNLYCSV